MEQKNLTYSKGLTAVPSDMLCSDEELELCDGMTYQDGELKPIQKPKKILDGGIVNRVLFVHHVANQDNYINTDGDAVYWYNENNTEPKNKKIADITVTNVEVIGNTLVLNTSDGLRYAIWNGSRHNYEYIEKLPIPEMEFYVHTGYESGGSISGEKSQSYEGILSYTQRIAGDAQKYWAVEDEKSYNDTVIGLYSACKKQVEEKNAFIYPFFLRYALKLYDGTYTYISNPVLIFPCVKEAHYMQANLNDKILWSYIKGHHIGFEINRELVSTLWKDIIKGITVFASPGIATYETDNADTIASGYFPSANDPDGVNSHGNYYQNDIPMPAGDWVNLCFLKRKSESEILYELSQTSTFFKICDIDINEYITSPIRTLQNYMHAHVVTNLTTQEQLPNDDFYSHCPVTANVIKTYNRRITLGDIHRGFFDGFKNHTVFKLNGSRNHFATYVYIKTDTGDRIVKVEGNHLQGDMPGVWFYYPDARAYKAEAWIKDNSSWYVFTMNLTPHSGLNGAYYIGDLPKENFGSSWEYDSRFTKRPETAIMPTPNYEFEELPSVLMTSEVNNPWLFLAKGYNYVPDTKIIGLATTTSAISQGQFGAYPLLVFTNKGIYSMTVADDGYYSGVKPPMSREVCNNPNSITEVDNAVFFTSSKGLMLITGGNVTCVSKQLKSHINTDAVSNGYIDIEDFFSDCDIAYDYKSNMLFIFKPQTTFCLIYNFASGTFSFAKNDVFLTHTLNNYPDYLIQSYIDSGSSTPSPTPLDDDIKDYFSLDNTTQYYLATAENIQPDADDISNATKPVLNNTDQKYLWRKTIFKYMFDNISETDTDVYPNAAIPSCVQLYGTGSMSRNGFDYIGELSSTDAGLRIVLANTKEYTDDDSPTSGYEYAFSCEVSSLDDNPITAITIENNQPEMTLYEIDDTAVNVEGTFNLDVSKTVHTILIHGEYSESGAYNGDIIIHCFSRSQERQVKFSKVKLEYSNTKTTYIPHVEDVAETQVECIAEYGDSGAGVFSLIQKPNEDDDENVYSGVIQTRPLKLGNAMTLKSIRQVKNLMYMNENANVSMRLFVSNDLHTWTEVGTIKGAGYKFFKIRYEFTGMKATDRFTTTVVRYEPRQSHILR